MQRIQNEIERSGDNPIQDLFPATERQEDGAHISELLPCYFFDYIVGTSTGGYGDSCTPNDFAMRCDAS